MPAAIKCCRYCVDDRTDSCHSTCEKYIKEKAEHDRKMAKYKAKKEIEVYMENRRMKRNEIFLKMTQSNKRYKK